MTRQEQCENDLKALRRDFEIVRSASRMFEEAANNWMERALKAEAELKGLKAK